MGNSTTAVWDMVARFVAVTPPTLGSNPIQSNPRFCSFFAVLVIVIEDIVFGFRFFFVVSFF
jgi:hypothetical protein